MENSQNNTRQSVSDMVFERLKRSIVAGEWQPGEKIPSEDRLCKEMDVSRVSIRAAISRLSAIGLLESRQGGGTYVCILSGAEHIGSIIPYIALDRPDRISMFEFRKIVEVESAGLAAMRADVETVNELWDLSMRMRESSDPEQTATFDAEFHYMIAKATRNPIIIRVFEVLQDTYYALIKQNVDLIGVYGARYHELICGAIESRDSALARKYMEEHLTTSARMASEMGKQLHSGDWAKAQSPEYDN